MKRTKQQEIEILVEKASNCEEIFRKFNPKRCQYSGAQRQNLICAYNAFRRATKKLEKKQMSLGE